MMRDPIQIFVDLLFILQTLPLNNLPALNLDQDAAFSLTIVALVDVFPAQYFPEKVSVSLIRTMTILTTGLLGLRLRNL